MKLKGLDILTLLLWLGFVLMGSKGYTQGWQATYPDLLYPVTCATPDGGSVLLTTRSISNQRTMVLLKLNDRGEIQWQTDVATQADGKSVCLTESHEIIVSGTLSYGFGNSDVLVAKYDLLSNKIWQKIFDFALADEAACLEVVTNGLILAANSENQVRLFKTDGAGNLIWTYLYDNTFGQRPTSMDLSNQGNIIVATQRPGLPVLAPAAYLLQADAQGGFQYLREFLHYSNFSTTNIAAVCVQSDTSYWFAHRDSVYELDTLGLVKTAIRLPSQFNFYVTDILPDVNGGFYAFGTDYTYVQPAQSRAYFGLFSSLGIPQWIRNYTSPSFTHATWGAESVPKQGFLLSGHYASGNNFFSYLIQADEAGQAFTNQIEGIIFQDANDNCSIDNNESSLAGWFVRILHPNGAIHYAVTDSVGHYRADVGKGAYEVSAITANSLWESNCNVTETLLFDSSFRIQTTNFPIHSEADCPLGWVDLDFNNWQPCVDNTVLLAYSNKGTSVMADSKISIILDSLLTLVSASKPYIYNGNHEYVFSIGELNPLEQGEITALVRPACEGIAEGQSLCIEANISPYSPCFIEGQAFLNVTGVCDGDSIRFTVQNLSGPMQNPQEFVIIEDNLMYKRASFQLGVGGQRTEAVPANGATWRFETAQPSVLPTWQSDPLVAAVVEGCTVSGAFSTGYLDQYSLFDGAYYTETTCRTVESAYAGQLKTAIPTGYGSSNNIPQNTDLEYTIYFQNTGSDTARSVILTDTLDHQVLDIATLEPGVGSWPYRWQVTGQGILTIDFPDIILPDSASNLAKSRGWVKFRIKQWPNLEPETIIENHAEVSFNYGTDLSAGGTFHTVVKALTYTDQVDKPEPLYYLYPMPSEGDVTIVAPESREYRVIVTDIQGKTIEDLTLEGHVLPIPGKHMAAGIYIVSLWSTQTRVSTLKIIKL